MENTNLKKSDYIFLKVNSHRYTYVLQPLQSMPSENEIKDNQENDIILESSVQKDINPFERITNVGGFQLDRDTNMMVHRIAQF